MLQTIVIFLIPIFIVNTKKLNEMKKLSTLLLLVLIFTTSMACAHPRQSTDKFEVSNFTAIKSSVVANVEIRQSPETSVIAEGDDDMLDLLKVRMDNETLVIEMNKKRINRFKNNANKLTIIITTPNLTKIESEGVGNITIAGSFETPKLKIDSEGVGNFRAENLYAGTVEIESDGVGNIKVGGNAESVYIKSEGIGNTDAKDLISLTTYVESDGVGNVSCYASEYLKIDSEGIGNTTYYGKPKQSNINKDGVKE